MIWKGALALYYAWKKYWTLYFERVEPPDIPGGSENTNVLDSDKKEEEEEENFQVGCISF